VPAGAELGGSDRPAARFLTVEPIRVVRYHSISTPATPATTRRVHPGGKELWRTHEATPTPISSQPQQHHAFARRPQRHAACLCWASCIRLRIRAVYWEAPLFYPLVTLDMGAAVPIVSRFFIIPSLPSLPLSRARACARSVPSQLSLSRLPLFHLSVSRIYPSLILFFWALCA
jgi:hypothetical protein